MHAIYTRASVVKIRLGEPFEDVELALESFEKLATNTTKETDDVPDPEPEHGDDV